LDTRRDRDADGAEHSGARPLQVAAQQEPLSLTLHLGGISALLLADLLVTAVVVVLGQILPSTPTPQDFPLWRAATFAGSWAFLTLAIALVYRILPDAKIAWRDVSVGAGSSGPLFLARQSLDRLFSGRGRHRIGLRCSRCDRDRPAVGLLLLAGCAVRRGVHTGSRQTPRRALEPKENAVRATRRITPDGFPNYWQAF
jgi:Virulence factor BrkB